MARIDLVLRRLIQNRCPTDCPVISDEIESLSNYLSVIHIVFKRHENSCFWFRGHGSIDWELIPSALRYKSEAHRSAAISLVNEFRRTADLRLERPPPFEDLSKWTQIAQHYGLPTRLLDWTSNAAVALFFCCKHLNSDGVVYMMNPTDINANHSYINTSRLVDSDQDRVLIDEYLRLGPRQSKQGKKTTIAIQPFINNERIRLQRGCFTLHGTKTNDLNSSLASSLIGVPILEKHKKNILEQLGAIGIDEMSIFPEIEHICSHLKYMSGLIK